VNDLPALAPCPADKRGRHSVAAIFSSEGNHDMTMFCEHCGMVRRLPMSGEVGVPLDMLSVDEILRRVNTT
jgi:hypothetical protein